VKLLKINIKINSLIPKQKYKWLCKIQFRNMVKKIWIVRNSETSIDKS
jgi:hypothetical protein